jgi:(1->4)-alpha-D-glucan 1-alpha-D-glucosylmutase
VVDHQSINPEIGSPEEHDRFCQALQERQLGQLLDVVSNHMGIGKHNKLWQDLLENGPSSVSARFFDVDWDPVKAELKNKVLLPLLGDQYGEVLERGELRLSFLEGAFDIHYYDETFPVAPRLYGSILGRRLEVLQNVLGKDHPSFVEMQSILTAIEHLPSRMEQDAAKVVERYREKEVIKRRLAVVSTESPEARRNIEDNVEAINGTVGQPHSFDLLDELLSRCSYRLAHWRVAGEEINYRRFFDINSLAAIRVEDPEVFHETHALVFRWLSEGKVTGLRIDHPDGLFDPTAYFLRLQERYFLERARQRPEYFGLAPAMQASVERRISERWVGESQQHPDSSILRALYVVIEKIQGGRERIPGAWAVHGTTGYRFANVVNGLFIERDNERELTRIYERFIDRTFDFGQLLYEKKKLIMNMSMASEINVLARELNRISEMNRHSRDYTVGSLRQALVEFVALFPVYRSYVDDWRREVDEGDIRYIEWTIRRAKEMDPTTNSLIYDFLRDILLRRYAEYVTNAQRAVMLRFTMKLQQLTGPVMAKGLEDTVFYIYNRFIALNEVG